MADNGQSTWRDVPKSIWALGVTSLFMDTSSELIHSILPVFLVTTLAANATIVGIIEGIAELTASTAKVFSGVLSDWIGKRKLLVVIGYAFSAMTKLIFPLATGAGAVLAARFLDRIGKGIRDAPRDALIADITPAGLRGSAYGLRQALDTAGAFLGPVCAVGLLAVFADFRAVFWWAFVPAVFSVTVLIFGVKEPPAAASREPARLPIRREDISRLSRAYWWVVGVGVICSLARFSEAFLVLKAHTVGLATGLAPLVWVLMNMVYSAVAAPAGILSDRIGRRKLLLVALSVLVAGDLVLTFADNVGSVFLGVALWGAFLGLSQGLLSALVSDKAPEELRGTAFGIFNLATGVALLLSSTAAGLLWTSLGPAVTFGAGAFFAACAAIGVSLRPSRIT
jgi:MFS family permease